MKKIKSLLLGVMFFMSLTVTCLNTNIIDANAARSFTISWDKWSTQYYEFYLHDGSMGYSVQCTPSVKEYTVSGNYKASGQTVSKTTSITWTINVSGNTSGWSNADFTTAKGLVGPYLPTSGSVSVKVSRVGTNTGTHTIKVNGNSKSYNAYATGVDYSTGSGTEKGSQRITSTASTELLEGTNPTAAHVTTNVDEQQRTVTYWAHGNDTYGSWNWVNIATNVTESSVTTSSTEPGTRNVTVTYGSLSTTCSMTWYKKDLESITATYSGGGVTEGLAFDKTKVQITAKFNNGTETTFYGTETGVRFTPEKVEVVGDNTITVYYKYTGKNEIEKSTTFNVTGLKKDLESITASYEGDDVVEELKVPVDKIEIVATYNNGTTETFTAADTNDRGNVVIKNSAGTEVYNKDGNINNMTTTRYNENNGSITYTVINEYTGNTSVSKSATITVNVIKKTPVSISASYPESESVIEGMPFDREKVQIKVTYNNDTELVINATSDGIVGYSETDDCIVSGYTNGFSLTIYNAYSGDTAVDDFVGDTSYGEDWDTIVYNVGKNRFVVRFEENEKEVTCEFTVNGIQKKAVHISAKYIGPDVTIGLEYLKGNVILEVEYDNGTFGLIKGTSGSVKLLNDKGEEKRVVPNIGENKYTAVYQECSSDFVVVGKEAILTSIYVLLRPDRVFYSEGDDFDTTGMIVMATYSDYREEMVPLNALEIPDGLGLQEGQDYVTLKYTVGDITKETQVEIFVDIGTLSYLTIVQEPNKVNYLPGEDFNPTGMIVTATYSTGRDRIVQGYEYEIIGGQKLQSGQQYVTISLTERDITVDVDQPILVKPKELDHIEILRKPNKTSYFPGENFNPAGMAVTAYYSDESAEVVTDECVILDGVGLALGKKTVTVAYTEKTGEGEVTKTADVNIVVADATVNNITAIYMGGKIKVNEAFNPADVMITINYTDGTSATVDGNYDGVSFSTLIIRNVNNSVTVSYRGHTCVIKIPILNDNNDEGQTITEIVSKANWQEFFTVRKTSAVEDYYMSGGYKIPYIRKGSTTEKPITMNIQFKLHAIEMGGWTTWYNSGEQVSVGGAPATKMKVGLLNANGAKLNAVVNGQTYNDLTSATEIANPQTLRFTLSGADGVKLQYNATYNGTTSGWVDEGQLVGISGYQIQGISFRIVRK